MGLLGQDVLGQRLDRLRRGIHGLRELTMPGGKDAAAGDRARTREVYGVCGRCRLSPLWVWLGDEWRVSVVMAGAARRRAGRKAMQCAERGGGDGGDARSGAVRCGAGAATGTCRRATRRGVESVGGGGVCGGA